MQIRSYVIRLALGFLAQAALATAAQSATWTVNATFNAGGIGFSCAGATFTVPDTGGSASFTCDVATVTATVDIPGLSVSVGGFGNVSFSGITCAGTGGGSSAITETSTTFTTSGTLSGGGTCSSAFGSFPYTLTGSYNASAASPGILSVSPTSGLSSSGDEGGPFSPSSKSYTLSNTGGSSIGFSVNKGENWVSLSKTGGTLSAGASTTVLVAIDSSANLLGPGDYSDTVSFTNTTNGQGDTSRSMNLTVDVKSVASVKSLSGDVRIEIEGIESQLALDTSVPDGALVTTGDDGRAELTLDGGGKAVLDPNTSFQFGSPVDGCTSLESCFNLLVGKVRMLLGTPGRVRTPTACTCVRGTEFSVEHKQVGENGRTTVVVFSGSVDVIENDGTITLVNAGEQVTVGDLASLPWLPLLLDK